MADTTFIYRVIFTTPAFLGNAEQNGQWRTSQVVGPVNHSAKERMQ